MLSCLRLIVSWLPFVSLCLALFSLSMSTRCLIESLACSLTYARNRPPSAHQPACMPAFHRLQLPTETRARSRTLLLTLILSLSLSMALSLSLCLSRIAHSFSLTTPRSSVLSRLALPTHALVLLRLIDATQTPSRAAEPSNFQSLGPHSSTRSSQLPLLAYLSHFPFLYVSE